MKLLNRWRQFTGCLLLALVLSLASSSMTFAADTAAAQTQTTTTSTQTKAKKRTGLQIVRGHYYFYDSNGNVTGGTLKNGTYSLKSRNIIYYLKSSKVVEAYKKGSDYYYPNGKKMTTVQANDFATQLTARKIAASITNDKMTKSQKLLVCFKWVMAKSYSYTRKFNQNIAGWPAIYANDHFQKGRGDCRSDASAFAYLAEAIGYTNVYVCTDGKADKGKSVCHAWCEINGRYYDPLFCQSKNRGGYKMNYGAKFVKDGGTCKRNARVRVQIS